MNKIKLTVTVVLLSYLHLASLLQYFCPPGEIGHKHKLNFFLPYNKTDNSSKIFVQREWELVAACKVDTNCSNYLPGLYKISLTLNSSTYLNEIEITIFNITGVNETLWILDYSNHNLSCTVEVYLKVSISCHHESLSNGTLQISCKTSPAYPAMNGNISLYRPNSSNGFSMNRTMICNNTTIQDKPFYYSVQCELALPIYDVGPGIYNSTVTMSPAFINGVYDYKMTSNTSFLINLENPTVAIENCPAIVYENEDINCSCRRIDGSKIPATIYWISDNINWTDVTSNATYLKVTNVTRPNPGEHYFDFKIN